MIRIGLLLCLSVSGCGNLYLDAVLHRGSDSDTGPVVETDAANDSMPRDTEPSDSRIAEHLGRGLVAVDQGPLGVYLSWRLLSSDDAGIGFDVYRNNTRVNDASVTGTTDFLDEGGAAADIYFVRTGEGPSKGAQSETVGVLPEPYRTIPLSGDSSVHSVGVGDLDADGEYDFVVLRPRGLVLPDNTHSPSSETFKLEAYNRDGALLWRIDLGWNIELGRTFCPFAVFDLNGDGIAEVLAKTAEGTVDGEGQVIGDGDGDEVVDYRDENGRVLAGPEFLSVFDGRTGKEIARTDWIARGEVADWGDTYGNRVNHNVLSIAYLDGKRPSIAALRGIAELQKVWTYDFSGGALSVRWTWSSSDEGAGYIGGAYHAARTGDIDGDGRDEIVPGAFALDDDGKALWSTYEGHGDRLHLAEIDPSAQGLEIWYCQEAGGYYQHPVSLRHADTGALMFGPEEDWGAVVRAMAADIDGAVPGMELWGTQGPLYSSTGALLGENPGTCNFAVFFDGDPQRELLDTGGETGYDLYKWMSSEKALRLLEHFDGDFVGAFDLFGDWREEIVIALPGALRMYTTVDLAALRAVTLMQDPTYRVGAAQATAGAYQSPEPGFLFTE